MDVALMLMHDQDLAALEKRLAKEIPKAQALLAAARKEQKRRKRATRPDNKDRQ